ncbi:hypothetical protein OSB04_026245 [Centaurea solstitialis]|uniref:Pectinesterase inhibitor domain-containing protein n=1 Tax=Centaurea solstitialis TaxID=347529 RepID=A0AA38SCS3_9ASTR|nr:hypothetical protein OSB04_026245 [Centaurea solstitialis]
MQPFTSLLLSLPLLAIFNLTLISATSRFLTETNSTQLDFIKASCETTRYPDLCFETLSPFSNAIQTSPTELVNAALMVSLKGVKAASKAVKVLSKGAVLSGGAVSDCLENMSDSVDEMKKSMVAMKDLDGPDFKEKMGDVKTWVSAALTDEDTCMDGFEENGDVKMKETIRGYIVNVAELTSIALALISNIYST